MADKNDSAIPVGVADLLNAGVHFGHQSKRWNPKMKRFIFGKRNGIYIIDLTKSLAQLENAKKFIYDMVSHGRKIVFVGTKRQGQEIIKEAATRCGQYYVISRWLGGTLTNYQNIANSINHMKEIEGMAEKGILDSMPQKEASRLRHELTRLQRNLTGIAGLAGMPGAMIVVDVNREAIAVREANRVGIPVVAMVDTNCDPDPIDYPIPANDDSTRAIKLIVNALADTIIKANAEYSQNAARQQQEQATDAKKEEPERKPRFAPSRERRPRRAGPQRGARSAESKSRESKEAEKHAGKHSEPAPKPEPTPAPVPETTPESPKS